jgi:DNA-binding LacI/PurR family transcriptional regulator
MPATIRQIAKRSHVSPATVSRVLNNYPHVDEETRTAVMHVADQLGYNLKTRNPTPRIARSVLLLVRDDGIDTQDLTATGKEFERSVAVALHPVFEKHGIATRLQRTRFATDEVPTYTKDPSVAGLILLGGVINHDFVRELQKSDLAFVVVGAHIQPLQVNCVVADYVSGMEQAVTHLALIGRQRIGLVNGPATTSSSTDKYRGFRLALALHDLEFVPTRIARSDFDAEPGYIQTQELLRRAPDLNAIAYAQDTMALGGLRAIKESGRRVPEDIAVTGFYDYEIARFADPPLTTVRFNIQTMGVLAAERLCQLLGERDRSSWMTVMPTTLVTRASTGVR